MEQRFTVDRASFEQFLGATSLIQQLKGQRGHVDSFEPAQPLSELVETQLAIENETLDFNAAMNRVVELALNASRATAAGLWLSREGDFVFQTGAGTGARDKRFEFEVLSKLATNGHPFAPSGATEDWNVRPDATHYPGSIKSLLVVPIYQARNIAGALALFSTHFDAFTEQVANRIRLLSGLVTRALGKAAESEFKQAVTEERAALLQAIERLIPALTGLVDKERQDSRQVRTKESQSSTEAEPGGVRTGLIARLLQGAGKLPEQLPQVEASIPAVVRASEPAAEIPASPTPPPTPRMRGADRIAAAVPSRDYLEEMSLWATDAMTRCSKTLSQAGVAARDIGRRAPALTLRTIQTVLQNALRVAGHRVRVRVPTHLMWRVRTLSIISGATIVLLTIATFLLLSTVGNRTTGTIVGPSEAIASSSAPDVNRKSGRRLSESLGAGVARVAPQSHHEITDPAVASALHSLSRYEVAGLRRRAQFGDDSAALLLGMAYETGTLVPPNCEKAAAWIAQAANAGRPAAEYNLGLRYRTGDGLPVDPEAAARWLTKAAAHKYPQARAALEAAP